MNLINKAFETTVEGTQKPKAFTKERGQMWKEGNKMRGQMVKQNKNLDRIFVMAFKKVQCELSLKSQQGDHQKQI